jgi:hypothetical protein
MNEEYQFVFLYFTHNFYCTFEFYPWWFLNTCSANSQYTRTTYMVYSNKIYTVKIIDVNKYNLETNQG